MNLSPEEKMARRILKKHGLASPFDLKAFVANYAEVVFKPIPYEGVDGVCLHLKRKGKTPRIIVNTNTSRTRQKFTLAHELGHIIIPWHTGNIVDTLTENPVQENIAYWQAEREANKFASELLVPFEWIYSNYKQNPDPDFLLSQILDSYGISEEAASIRLRNALSEIEQIEVPPEAIQNHYKRLKDPARVFDVFDSTTHLAHTRIASLMAQSLSGHIAYCIESDGIVVDCGHTGGTHSFYQSKGDVFLPQPYSYFKQYSKSKSYDANVHWWILDKTFDIPDDKREWKEIIEKISKEIQPLEGIPNLKVHINSSLSGTYGNWIRKNPSGNVTKFIEESIQHFNLPHYKNLVQHRDFLVFIKKRCEALFAKKPSSTLLLK